MIIITDSNIIYSALISPNGSVATIFKEKSNLQFIAPIYLLEEVINHWNIIVDASPLSVHELFAEFNYYKKKISFTTLEDIPKKHVLKAHKIINDIDQDDLDFIALHLHTKHKLW